MASVTLTSMGQLKRNCGWQKNATRTETLYPGVCCALLVCYHLHIRTAERFIKIPHGHFRAGNGRMEPATRLHCKRK